MWAWVTSWIHDQLDDDDLIANGRVHRFAYRLSFKTVIVADILNVLMHLVLSEFGLLPYSLSRALVVGCLMTTVIAVSVAYVFASVIGNALCKVAISRDDMARLSSTDPLSGLLNRRAFFERVARYEAGAVFILFDIDRFKAVNDTHGHLVGDRVIQGVGRVLGEVFLSRQAEVARLGGEEFSVVMSKAHHDDHMDLVETARARVSAMDIGLGAIRVTVSAGVADIRRGREMTQSYSMADRALYLAKSSGRNRIVHEDEIERFPQAPDRDTGWPGTMARMAS